MDRLLVDANTITQPLISQIRFLAKHKLVRYGLFSDFELFVIRITQFLHLDM